VFPAIQQHQVVNDVIAENRTVYGINTGLWFVSESRCASRRFGRITAYIVLSHAAGIGALMETKRLSLIMH